MNPRASVEGGLRISFVHLGNPRGGISRYERAIAASLRRLPCVRVDEIDGGLQARSLVRGLAALFRAVRHGRRADVVVVSYSRYGLWHAGYGRILQAVLFHLALRRRTVTILHDVYQLRGGRFARDPEAWAISAHLLLSGAVIVHREDERERLRRLPGSSRITVIPFYIDRSESGGRDRARRSLGVPEGAYVTAVLGWIHERKGHRLAVKALPELGRDVVLWFLGAPSPGSQTLVRELEKLGEQMGVSERLLVTGFLPDEELSQRIDAVDLALCPYLDASSSASLSTWLGSGTPVIASDIPVMREHAVLAPEAVRIFSHERPGGLAAAISAGRRAPSVPEQAFERLWDERSISAIAERYARVCRRVAGTRVG